MGNDKFNILIVGKGAAAGALCRKLLQNPDTGKIFITDKSASNSVDIREDDLTGLLKFVIENDINLTIPISDLALKSDIVNFFHANGQLVFGPSKESCEITLNKIYSKKFLYKIHAQTPKFGIYNKVPQITDYLSKSNFPVIIRTAENVYCQDELQVCPTMKSALNFIDNLFIKGETDVLIEDFVFGNNFTIYFITDGYSAIPITTVHNYKFKNDNQSGLYKEGVGCYCPDYKVSNIVTERVTKIAHDILKALDTKGCPYTGVLGIECVGTEDDRFFVTDLKHFFSNHDTRAVLNLCEDNLLKIFLSCINGYFADEYENIKMNNFSSISLTLFSKYENKEINLPNETEDIDFIDIKCTNDKYFTSGENVLTVTKTASTLTRAKKYLSESTEEINFDGIEYRKDICDKINP